MHKIISFIKQNNTKVREIAVSLLNDYEKNNTTLDKIVENNYQLSNLVTRDKAILKQLIYGTIRWRNKLDWIIKIMSDRPLIAISLYVLNVLRIAIFQILYMNSIPNSATVYTSVNLVKKNKSSKNTAGYVNAILRNTIRNLSQINIIMSKKKISIKQLSITKSFPHWIVSRWIKRFGYNETIKLCDNINTIPNIVLRVNTIKTTKKKLHNNLIKEVNKIENIDILPNALKISKVKYAISNMTTFSNGMFSIQDISAQMVSHILSPNPGETVLDACSGMGGKATHLSQIMKNKGKILAIDNNRIKLNEIQNEIKRLGINIIETQRHNLNKKLNYKKFPKFDKILIDAPCSNMGVIRRKPDIKWSMKPKKIKYHSNKQFNLLKNISILLKPKGLLAYAVCSTEPEENENVVNLFLHKNKNFKIKKVKEKTKKFNSYLDENGFFKIFPHIHGMDGFFVALLERIY